MKIQFKYIPANCRPPRWYTPNVQYTELAECTRGVPCQAHNPFRLTRVMQATQVTQTPGSRLSHCFLLVVSLIFPQCRLKISVCILPRVCSPHSAFCTQPVFYSQSAVCILHSVCILPLVRSLQSAVRSLRFTLTDSKKEQIVVRVAA